MPSLEQFLGSSGPLARCLPGFQPRIEQQRMAVAVAGAIEARATLVVEAGTGIGKTFAYLVPALLSGRKVIVSTGTKTLQDQLFHKDLPLVREALDIPVRVALLKGRGNYLCLHRLNMGAADGRFESWEQASAFQAVWQWSRVTRCGDLAEGPKGVLEPSLRTRVSSTADNCLGGECPRYGDCFLMEARRRAQEADILVINHHLLMADWVLKEGGFGEVLPAADAFILDEAHQLPETAAQFFGLSLSSRQLTELVRDTKLAYFEEAGDLPEVVEAADVLQRTVLDLRLGLGIASYRGIWAAVKEESNVLSAVEQLGGALRELDVILALLAPRGKGLENCWKRCKSLYAALQAYLEPQSPEHLQWFETYTQSFILRLTPLEVAEQFRGHMERHPAAWIFTSATLSVANDFSHFTRRLGLVDPATLVLDSPFDYRHNALLYVPPGLPPPNSEAYLEAFLSAIVPVLEASHGRAFVLFTSHRALSIAAEILRGRVDYPLLTQGEAAQNVLLERFRTLDNAVLLGTSSFWEGVDVRGEALSCVIIDRLPFASPSDPVMQAKIKALRCRDDNPFVEHQLPLAVIALRQGVGRLIRDTHDRGVLVIGDNRLLTKSYGRVFLNSLPPVPITRDLGRVQAFFGRS